MFFVPNNEQSSASGWTSQDFFATEATGHLLLVHVTPGSESKGPSGLWGFTKPEDLRKLMSGISRSDKGYTIAEIVLVTPPATRADGLKMETLNRITESRYYQPDGKRHLAMTFYSETGEVQAYNETECLGMKCTMEIYSSKNFS